MIRSAKIILIIVLLGASVFIWVDPFIQWLHIKNEVSALQQTTAGLQKQMHDLDVEIKKWDDKTYVINQAREQLGYVMPGEIAIHVTDIPKSEKNDNTNSTSSVKHQQDTWFETMIQSIKTTDQLTKKKNKTTKPSK